MQWTNGDSDVLSFNHGVPGRERNADAAACHLSTNEPAPSCLVSCKVHTYIIRCCTSSDLWPHGTVCGNVMRVIISRYPQQVELSVKKPTPQPRSSTWSKKNHSVTIFVLDNQEKKVADAVPHSIRQGRSREKGVPSTSDPNR